MPENITIGQALSETWRANLERCSLDQHFTLEVFLADTYSSTYRILCYRLGIAPMHIDMWLSQSTSSIPNDGSIVEPIKK